MQGVQVWPLVRQLRSHMPLGAAKYLKKHKQKTVPLRWSHHCLNLTLKLTYTVAWPLWALQSVNGFGKQTHTLIHRDLFVVVQSFSHIWLSVTHELQHTRLPCPSPSPRAYSNSCPLSSWCHPTISSSVVPFSSCLPSFPAWVFSNQSALRIRWQKYWSFNFFQWIFRADFL